jgi:hypothetical protein
MKKIILLFVCALPALCMSQKLKFTKQQASLKQYDLMKEVNKLYPDIEIIENVNYVELLPENSEFFTIANYSSPKYKKYYYRIYPENYHIHYSWDYIDGDWQEGDIYKVDGKIVRIDVTYKGGIKTASYYIDGMLKT